VNEGQRWRTGSLSLQAKSGASTAGAASRRTSSRHIYISYIEFILLIHIFNLYTKFIVLIHVINSLNAASTCLSRSTRITRGKWSFGGMPFALSLWNECNKLSMNIMNYTYDFSILIHCMNSYHKICIWINYIVK
jgi:hypothetical protein